MSAAAHTAPPVGGASEDTREDEAGAEPVGHDHALGTNIRRGLAWKLLSQGILQVVRLGVGLLIARLLTPADFGLASMTLVFSSLVIVFSDLAFGAAIVQRPTLTETDRSTVFWISTAGGIGFTALGVALSWPIAAFYGEPDVQPLFAVLSAVFAITSLGTIQTALLTREMRFRDLEVRMIAAGLVGSAVAVVLALRGFGAWAIIGQQLAVAIVSTLLVWRACTWRPTFRMSRASMRDLGGFSLHVLGQRLLFYLHRNADNLLVGRFLGAASLGVYALAYNVMLQPLARIASPVQEVLFPAFARVQTDVPRMVAMWLRATRMVAAIAAPALVGLVVVAPDFVEVVLGHKWQAATPVIQVLAWVGLVQAVQALDGDILQALDRTRILFRYSIAFFTGHLIAFFAGLPFGVLGVAVAYSISTTVLEPILLVLTCRALGVRVRDVLGNLAGVVVAAVAMAAVVLAVRVGLVDAGVPALARLPLCVLVGAAVYLPTLVLRDRRILADVREVRRARTSRSASS